MENENSVVSPEKIQKKNRFFNHKWANIFGYICLFAGLGSFLGSNIILGIIYIIIGLIITPRTYILLNKRLNINLSKNQRILISFILLIITPLLITNDANTINQTSNTEVVKEKVQDTKPSEPISLEQQITNKINEVLGTNTNMDKPVVVKVEVENYKSSELIAYGYKAEDKIKSVFIVINASENITTNLQKGAMAGEAEKIFKGVFPLSGDIGDIIIWSQLPIKDQYGNIKDDTAITYAMARPLFEKINWDNLNHRELPNLLNSEDKNDDRNGSYELLKF